MEVLPLLSSRKKNGGSRVTQAVTGKSSSKNKSRVPSLDEFLQRFRERAASCLENAYLGEHDVVESFDDGSITTTLCQDVFSLVNTMIELLHEFLTLKEMNKSATGEHVMVVSTLCVVRTLHRLQIQHRDKFLRTLESSCAAANDFMNMIECLDEAMEKMIYPRLGQKRGRRTEDVAKISMLEKEVSDLVALYGKDAVFAVQRAQIFVMYTIQKSAIPDDLFSRDWEDKYVYNEVSKSMVSTMDDFLSDFHKYLSSDFLYFKIVEALIRATVCFYFRTLVQKADKVRRKCRGHPFGPAEPPFNSPTRAVLRMTYDIEIFTSFFDNIVKQSPALNKRVQDELSALVVLHECLNLTTTNNNESTLEEFILVLHKRTGGNAYVTKFLMQDLWLLAVPHKRALLNGKLSLMQVDLQLLSMNMEESEKSQQQSRDYLPGLRLPEVLVQFYEGRILQEKMRPCCGPCINMIASKDPMLVVVKPPQHKAPSSITSLFNVDFLNQSDDSSSVPANLVHLS